MNIAIIGARGCVGITLIKRLLETTGHTIVASYRREEEPELVHERVHWKRVNLYDDLGTEEFLEGADVLIYLVHSLKMKNFTEMDRIFADRAGKFAKKMGIKKILYLGGIIPKNETVSVHLRSRQETGEVLARHSVPVAEVRASILLGTCSASYQMIHWLSKKLPIIFAPTWSKTKCSPIALEDAVDMMIALIGREIKGHEIFEIGSETMGYDELVMRSGNISRKKRNKIIYVPFFPICIAAYWVQALTGVSRHVAAVLMGSLRNDSVVTDNRFEEVVGRAPRPLDEVLRELHEQMEHK